MAIAKTGAFYKSLSFDNKSLRSYGVYITGSAVYNAPERAMEMISIPGRNGAFAMDQGRFENIEVSYPAGIFADNEADFAQAISDLRNFLCAKKGYCRLTDEYNPDEYRMAVYKSGLEVDPVRMIAGEFTITFECKPQRFLTSGEAETAVANNGTITNPSLFESKPVLKVQGYGDIGINSDTISVQSIPVGQLLLANSKNFYIDYPYSTAPLSTDYIGSQIIDATKLNTGDTFTLEVSSFTYTQTATITDEYFMVATATSQSGSGASTTAFIQGEKSGVWMTTFDPITFTKGTASSVIHTYERNYKFGSSSQSYTSGSRNETITIAYDGANEISLSASNEKHYGVDLISGAGFLNSITGFSTIQISGTITIDLDIGDAYWNNAGTIMNANNAVSFGAKLPTLQPGANTITYPNTLTSFKIIPNWWKV